MYSNIITYKSIYLSIYNDITMTQTILVDNEYFICHTFNTLSR